MFLSSECDYRHRTIELSPKQFLLEQLGDPLRADWESSASLEAQLHTWLTEIPAAVGVRLEGKVFLEYLAERWPSKPELSSLFAEDLYLACACIHQAPKAVERLFSRHESALRKTLSQVTRDKSLTEEALQSTWIRVLCSPNGATGKLVDYSGRGPLAAWLQVVGIRQALELLRSEQTRGTVGIEQALELPLESSDSVSAQLDRRHLAATFQQSIRTLSSRERAILRLNVLEGLNIEEIGRLYNVHRATVARWLVGARESLLADIRGKLSTELRLSPAELESLLRLADSHLDLSLARIL